MHNYLLSPSAGMPSQGVFSLDLTRPASCCAGFFVSGGARLRAQHRVECLRDGPLIGRDGRRCDRHHQSARSPFGERDAFDEDHQGKGELEASAFPQDMPSWKSGWHQNLRGATARGVGHRMGVSSAHSVSGALLAMLLGPASKRSAEASIVCGAQGRAWVSRLQ